MLLGSISHCSAACCCPRANHHAVLITVQAAMACIGRCRLLCNTSQPRCPLRTLCAGRLRSFWWRMVAQMSAVLMGSESAGRRSGLRRTRLSPTSSTSSGGENLAAGG